MNPIFRPKLYDTLQDYSWSKFSRDAMAGFIVGIVALPLAIAFAIASGVSPEKGIITAVVAGFLISALGGSRVQIGGPTGAFIVIVYGIVQQYGIDGLIVSTLLAGCFLVLMGIARLGSIIKFIPYSLIIGFTSGIAVIIFSSQIKDIFGLEMGAVPADFIEKWQAFIANFDTVNLYATAISLSTIFIILLFPRYSKKLPGSLVAILLTTIVVHYYHLPVETIGSRFGTISSSLPTPQLPDINLKIIQELIQPAFTIAMLGAIESLLSAVVADGMMGGNHRSNTELIAQGVGNIGSALFGGIPATGALARTATNVKNNGRTPIAGIVHAVVLLIILIFLGQWASYIPLSCLAGVLVVIAFNMSEYKNFISILKGPRGDIFVMVSTFFLTILISLTIAIEVGVIVAAFSFIYKMVQNSTVSFSNDDRKDQELETELLRANLSLPSNTTVFEISGPMFFGAAYKIREGLKFMDRHTEVFIIRMRHVPVIDATGISSFRKLIEQVQKQNIKVVLTGLDSEQVKTELENMGILTLIGRQNIYPDIIQAIQDLSPEDHF